MIVVRVPALRSDAPPGARDAQDTAAQSTIKEEPKMPRREFVRSHTYASGAAPEVVMPSAPLDYPAPPETGPPPYARMSDSADDMKHLLKSLRQARRIAVVCGAGISVSAPANIPDFRSADGLFRRLKERYPNANLSSGKDLFDASLFTVRWLLTVGVDHLTLLQHDRRAQGHD